MNTSSILITGGTVVFGKVFLHIMLKRTRIKPIVTFMPEDNCLGQLAE